MGILPREELPGHPRRVLLDAANSAIETWAKEHKVDFLKINDKFLDGEGTLSRELCRDLCHPTEKGYRIWAEALQPYLPPRD
jgi:lysophospholipase L1-like esterase